MADRVAGVAAKAVRSRADAVRGRGRAGAGNSSAGTVAEGVREKPVRVRAASRAAVAGRAVVDFRAVAARGAVAAILAGVSGRASGRGKTTPSIIRGGSR